MKLNSVRLRLLLWNTGILALVLFLFLVAAHMTVRTYLVRALDRRLELVGVRPGRLPRTELVPRAVASHGLRRVLLFDGNGLPLTLSGKPAPEGDGPWDRAAIAEAASGKSVFSTVQDGEVTLRVLTRPFYADGEQVGVMQVAASYLEVQTLLESLTKISLVLAPCALLVAALGGLFLTHRALQPVRHLVETADALNPEDLSQRLPVVGADEFAHLATTMNATLARVEEAFSRLRDALDRERRFASDASHELKTPLTALKANTSLALRGERTPEQYRRALQEADQAADTMQHLVQDLLLLARSDSGQLALRPEPVRLEELFAHALATARISDTQAAVTVQVAPDATQVMADPHHLGRAVLNLLTNALRHTPQEGTVTVSASREGAHLVVSVADTGEGIPAEHLPHLGERFYRVDTARARQHGGTGLGLALCKSIVDAHGGTMTIDSTVGQGTVVRLSLPAGGL